MNTWVIEEHIHIRHYLTHFRQDTCLDQRDRRERQLRTEYLRSAECSSLPSVLLPERICKPQNERRRTDLQASARPYLNEPRKLVSVGTAPGIQGRCFLMTANYDGRPWRSRDSQLCNATVRSPDSPRESSPQRYVHCKMSFESIQFPEA